MAVTALFATTEGINDSDFLRDLSIQILTALIVVAAASLVIHACLGRLGLKSKPTLRVILTIVVTFLLLMAIGYITEQLQA